MPRTPRILTEYMHVIIRGIGRQILFEDADDNMKFLHNISRFSKETKITIVAYCLMENHVHILLQDETHKTATFMHKLGTSYSRYYNHKYSHCGHLFQNRYKSETVEDDKYLLTVFRYILNNPVRANICAASEYDWSSYHEYGKTDGITNTGIIEELIGDEKRFRDFMMQDDKAECMENFDPAFTDEAAIHIIRDYLGTVSVTALKGFERGKRDEALAFFREKGLSIRQIERLTGINRGIILRAM